MASHRLLLLKQLSKRDIESRYKGSQLGMIWSFVVPLLMLVVYTFVFSVVFEARWKTDSGNKLEFALIIFSGMTVFNFFSEVISRSTSIIASNTNYVKKVIFPLEVLPVTVILSALFQALISFFILSIGILIIDGSLNWTMAYLPIVMLPVIFTATGLSWFLASLGTYIRDVNYAINIFISALMFLSPIFYPISSVPDDLKFIFHLNPLSYTVEDIRNIMLWGKQPNFEWLIIGSTIGLLTLMLGYFWFNKTKRGFADVL
ncbi:lipopolysaccharide transport system permease protein [Paenibacillaceae bacterium GAS479]|nr:lipopolysaccharide transport system permease protein [Paenibacillaceae bacterium GAS479]